MGVHPDDVKNVITEPKPGPDRVLALAKFCLPQSIADDSHGVLRAFTIVFWRDHSSGDRVNTENLEVISGYGLMRERLLLRSANRNGS